MVVVLFKGDDRKGKGFFCLLLCLYSYVNSIAVVAGLVSLPLD